MKSTFKMKEKAFFIVLEEPSFGEKIKNSRQKLDDLPMKLN